MDKPVALQKLLGNIRGDEFNLYDVWCYAIAGYTLGTFQKHLAGQHDQSTDQPDEENKSLGPGLKVDHWKAVDRTARKWEPDFSEMAIRAFETDQRNVLAIVSETKAAALELKASVDWKQGIQNVQRYIKSDGTDQWRKKFVPLLKGVMTEQGKRWALVTGMSFDVENFFATQWFEDYPPQQASERTRGRLPVSDSLRT